MIRFARPSPTHSSASASVAIIVFSAGSRASDSSRPVDGADPSARAGSRLRYPPGNADRSGSSTNTRSGDTSCVIVQTATRTGGPCDLLVRRLDRHDRRSAQGHRPAHAHAVSRDRPATPARSPTLSTVARVRDARRTSRGGGQPFPTIRCQSDCGAGHALSPPKLIQPFSSAASARPERPCCHNMIGRRRRRPATRKLHDPPDRRHDHHLGAPVAQHHRCQP